MRFLGLREYTPIEEATTSEPTRAFATAASTLDEPSTLIAQSRASLREGWITHARWITQSAPRKCGTRSSETTLAATNSVFA